ncbi:glycosyltransferase [Robbsia andropogonis]|uniref:glycosyltransferase n=1 Tax=Robbsia andropogonis TaxID=28092 RepID=UPI00209F98A9|nr:glycosyltransferase [Robbsia andropogonis]MCP1117663.1 glycosyltransferase [Robbsia andropogonis]MCP1127129.1 glycosyltransferase [Robbsia andropogonis]
MTSPELSVIIPVYNEEAGLNALFERLYPALDALDATYEIIFINDGSRDRSAAMLADQFAVRDDVTRVILLNGNYGQHMAILSGFEYARGEIVITLDADLQNPPEEIGKLVSKMREGYDYVGTIRSDRQDSWFRREASHWMNRLRERITRIKMTDQGCMLRAYSKRIISTINRCGEINTFIPALAYTFAQNPIEIDVAHEERFAGESKYSLYSLIRLNFDLVTGFSVVPLQMLSFVGVLMSAGSAALFFLLMFRRFMLGAEVQGVFTLFAINFFMIGIILFALGLLGEYIGRIYQQVRGRPRYLVQTFLTGDPAAPSAAPAAPANLPAGAAVDPSATIGKAPRFADEATVPVPLAADVPAPYGGGTPATEATVETPSGETR